MPAEEFRRQVRGADDLARRQAVFDTPPLRLAERVWLSAYAIAGYNPADFDTIGADERGRLDASVTQFRHIAEQPDPTPDEIERAGSLLRDIAELVELDRYIGDDSYLLGKRVEKAVGVRLPAWVADLRFETGDDSTGHPAVWVWVIVEDEAPDGPAARPLLELLEDAVRRVSPDRWPYVRFRTVSEQAEMAEAVAS